MKNITLSAEERLLELARRRAEAESSSLNQKFREWLRMYTRQEERASGYGELMKKLRHVEAGRRFSREELNER